MWACRAACAGICGWVGAGAGVPNSDDVGAGAGAPNKDVVGAGAGAPKIEVVGAGAGAPKSDGAGAGAAGLGEPNVWTVLVPQETIVMMKGL